MDRYRYEEAPDTEWCFRAHRADGTFLCTNREGQGLFCHSDYGVEQWAGTSQFQARTLDQFKRRLQARRRGLAAPPPEPVNW